MTIETPSLGDRSYLAHDGDVALVVDPQRDIDRVLEVADEAGVRITDVFETHLHNDYVTGGLALARRLGARYHVNAADEVSFDRAQIRDGDVVEVSDTMRVRAIPTPGHTFTHLSYALETGAGDQTTTTAVFSGGSLLFGATGRPDLLGEEHTSALVHHQYASIHRLADELPEQADVLPTHGFGSFCSAGSTGGATESTIGRERRVNPALTQDEEQWVVDLRTRTAFAAGHVTGTLNFGLDGQFSTYLGWLIPWDASLTLLGETSEEVAEAQREMTRIGFDRLAGAATGGPADWTDRPLGTLERANFADLSQVRHHRSVHVLDVRLAGEHADGHVEGAQNVPIGAVLDRLDEIPERELWVHCASGYRASIAASVLAARGRLVVVVDDDFDNAAPAGLPMTTPA